MYMAGFTANSLLYNDTWSLPSACRTRAESIKTNIKKNYQIKLHCINLYYNNQYIKP